jgi:hypothetical protein
MRFVRAVVVVCAVIAAVGIGTPALADVGFTVDKTSIDYVASYHGAVDVLQDFRVSGSGLDQDFHLRLETTSPGFGLVGNRMQGSGFTCTQGDPKVIECDLHGLNDATVLFEIRYSGQELEGAIGSSGTETYTTTGTLSKPNGGGVLDTLTTHLRVRGSADVGIGELFPQDLGDGHGPQLVIARQNHGPSGSPTTTMVVTGFLSPPTNLPTGCKTSGTTVTCVYHASINVDDTAVVRIPLTATEAGCRYTVHVIGSLPDPNSSNNTFTRSTPSMGCGSAGAAPTTTKSALGAPDANPTPTPSTSVSAAPTATTTTAPTDVAVATQTPATDPLPATAAAEITKTDSGYGLYFVVAAVALVLIGAGFWVLHRRRRRTPRP